jgi:hypothetical protein
MQKIFVLNGASLSGKTTLGKIVGEELEKRGINFLHTSSIDPVKALLMPFETWDATLAYNWPTMKDIKCMKENITEGKDWDGKTKDTFWRWAMSELKIRITEKYPTLIHEFVFNKINTIPEPYVAFVDIREPENIQGFRDFCHLKSRSIETAAIMVKSDGGKEFENRSDLSINNYPYDIAIENPRYAFVSDEIALWFLRARIKPFVDSEIMQNKKPERFY